MLSGRETAWLPMAAYLPGRGCRAGWVAALPGAVRAVAALGLGKVMAGAAAIDECNKGTSTFDLPIKAHPLSFCMTDTPLIAGRM